MRKNFLLVLPCLLLLAGTCKKEDEDGRENLIVNSSFEDSKPLRGWSNMQHCCDYSVTESDERATSGKKSLRLEIRSTDDKTSGSIRSEITQDAEAGTERWYGFTMYLENWEDDNAGEHVFQWHPNNLTGTATASLWTSGGRFVYVMNDGTPNAGNEYIDIGPTISNRWISWVIHVKWADDKTGLMQVWQNGKLVIDKHHLATAPSEGTYFKLGINKFGWGIQQSSTTRRVLYFDEVRIGNEKATYLDVVPGP